MFLNKGGFTLIELLLVIVIIAILAAAVFVAVDPVGRLADAKNAQRWEDTRAVLDAVLKYNIDNSSYPTGIDSVSGSSQVLGTAGSGCDATCTATTTVAACLDLSSDLVDKYIAAIPLDPKTGTSTNTDYYINKTANGRISIGACDAEQGSDGSTPTILVQR